MAGRVSMSAPEPLHGLRDARLRAGFTQAQAGGVICKTQSHFGKIERGAVRLDAWDALKLAQAFGVEISDLFKVTD